MEWNINYLGAFTLIKTGMQERIDMAENIQHNVRRDSIIEQLSSFDFNSPIQFKIIFEDEEENALSQVVIKQETKTEEAQPIFRKDLAKNAICDLEISKQVNSNNVSQAGSRESNQIKISTQGERGVKHKEISYSNNKCVPHTCNDDNLKRQLNDETNANMEANKKIKEDSVRQLNHNKQVVNIHEITHKNHSYVAKEDVNTNYDSNPEMTCITNLLKSVSNHLIRILEAYQKYNLVKNNKNANSVEIDKHHVEFLRTKYHFFNLSYCTIDNILLPQENNPFFIGNFLNETVKIAAKKNIILCPETQVSPLFIELLQWVKEKKRNIDKITFDSVNNSNYSNNQTNPLLKQYLNTTTKPLPTPQHAAQDLNNSCKKQRTTNLWVPPIVPPKRNIENAKSVVFSTGPPGRQVSISVEQALLKSCDDGSSTTNAVSITETPRNFNFIQSYGFQQVLSTVNQTRLQNNQSNYQPYTPQTTQQRFTNTIPLYPPPSYPLPTAYASPQNLQSNGPHGYQNTTARPPPWAQCISNNTRATEMQQTAQAQPLQIQNEQQTPEIARSLSTDSGFMSPLHFNNNSEMNSMEEGQTPVISHITSLHPEASFIPEGKCYVCGKITRKKCVGCYTRYYCGNPCQRFDWNIHKIMCLQLSGAMQLN